MDIIRGGAGRHRRPGTASRALRPSSGARRSWARDSAGVSDAGGRLRAKPRPATAPAARSQLIRPGSADSKHLRELYKGVNVGRGNRPVTSGGKVDAQMLVAALDSVEHTEAQLKAMRRIMQLCDPKPSAKLASANCRALAAAGGIPVLVRLLTCGATQLEWGAVLSLGSIAAFDNSTNAGSKHEIRQHGGLGDFVAMLWHHSLGVQKLAACAIANMAHNAWPEYGTLQQEIAQEVRIARSNGLGGFERLLQLLEGKPDEVTEWAAAAICNLSLCDEDSREHIFFADGMTTLVRCLETVAPDLDAVELVRAAPAYQDQRLVPTEQEQKVSELVASTLCNLAADNEQRAGTICEKGGVGALVRLLFSTAPALVEGALHSLRNIASTSPEHAAQIVAERAVERVVFCLLTEASQSAHAAAASLLHVLAASGGDIWDGGEAPTDWTNDPSADAGGNGDEHRKSEYRWLPDTSGAVCSGSQAIARCGGVPALIKHLYTPQAGPPAAATLQAMGVDVRSARIVLEGLAGDLDRAVEVYEQRLSAQQEAFDRLMEENKRLKSQVDQAAAKERERASREYWGEDDEGDEGILPLEDGDVVKIIRPGSPSGSGHGGSVAGGGVDSRPSSGSGSRPGSASILRRPGSGAGSRPGSAPADDKRSRQVTYWRDKKMEEEQTKAAPPEKPGSVEAELVAAKRMERIAKEKEEKDPQMVQLNELLRLAQQHDLPGVDPNSISAIKRNISSGRFPHQHYIVLFTTRLEDKGIDIEEALAERARQAQRLGESKSDGDFSWVAAAEGDAYTKPPGTGPYGVGPPATAEDAAKMVGIEGQPRLGPRQAAAAERAVTAAAHGLDFDKRGGAPRAVMPTVRTPQRENGLRLDADFPISRPGSAASLSTLPSRPGSAASLRSNGPGHSRPSSAASTRSGSYESNAALRPPATAVEEWLREVNLGRYAARFAERGITSLPELQAMPKDVVRSLGMKVLEERRFLRSRAAIAA